MDSQERISIANKLIEQQQTLRGVFEACETQGRLCEAAGAKRMAFTVFMLKEALLCYSRELNAFVLKFIAEEPLEDDEFPLDY